MLEMITICDDTRSSIITHITHITYCLAVWGAKKMALTELKKSIRKSWIKIGERKQHTNQRLIEHSILKFEDKLKISKIKIVLR